MVNQCTDIDKVLRDIKKRMRKLEKSDSEKTEEIGRLNRLIGQKDVEIHRLQTKLDSANFNKSSGNKSFNKAPTSLVSLESISAPNPIELFLVYIVPNYIHYIHISMMHQQQYYLQYEVELVLYWIFLYENIFAVLLIALP